MSSLERLRSLPRGVDKVHILIFYRGEWCPFCSTWAQGMSSIRQLRSRLTEMNATVCFISSQPESKEAIAAQRFRFTRQRGLGSNVRFINDPENKIAEMLNNFDHNHKKPLVAVEMVSAQYVDGVDFPKGMTQPAVVVCKDLFDTNQIIDVYTYDSSGEGGINGDDNRPAACTTLRQIERLHANLYNKPQCS